MKNGAPGCLGDFLGIFSYSVVSWGLCHKPFYKDPLDMAPPYNSGVREG